MNQDSPSDITNQSNDPQVRADDTGLYLQIKEWVQADIDHSSKWRTTAREEFTFVAGPGQWSTEDRNKLRDEQRPDVTFNKTLKFVRAVCGIEANNRHETVFLPSDITDPGDIKQNEMLTGVNDWMDRGCNAGKQQSRAFRDAFICGMGFTEDRIDFDEDSKGKYIEERRVPWEMGWDCNARNDNLTDARRMWHARKMPLSEASALIPGVTDAPDVMDDDLDASWVSDLSGTAPGETKSKEQKELREEARIDDPKREVTIVHIQWWEYETYYRTIDPEAVDPQTQRRGMAVDATPQQYQALNAKYGVNFAGTPDGRFQAGKWPGQAMRRKVYKRAFVGGKVLQSGPAPRKDGFTFHAVTYEPDDTEGVWFGVVRVLRDPQVWSNKFFAQVMHIINSTAKGGVLVEKGAMDDAAEFLKNYAKPNAVTVVADGAIAKGKIMAKPGAGLTAGVLNLLQIAETAFQGTLGVNLELLGLADRDQPGVLEAQRKQAAMTILATLFDNFSLMKQDVGKSRLYFIQNILATDQARMIRVVGDSGYKAVPLLKKDVQGEYDVIVSDAPSSPNTKEKVWAALMQVLPAFKEMITPEVAVMIMEYAPGLPSKLVEALRAIATRPNPEADEQKQIAKATAVADIQNKRADTEKKKVDADVALAGALIEVAQVGVAQAAGEVQTFNAIVNALGGEKDRNIALQQAANEDVISPSNGPAQPPQEPQELGEMRPPTEGMPMMPGGLMPPGGL